MSTDVLLDVTPGLTLCRVDGVWTYVSRMNLPSDQVVATLREQARRLESRADLLLEAAAFLEGKDSP